MSKCSSTVKQGGFESCRRCSQRGFTFGRLSAQQGFTLIELLVSLMIFSLLAAAGVLLLRGSVDTQAAVRAHLDALGDVQRGIATLDSDLSQAVSRLSRTETGTSAPAFFGREAQGNEPVVEFVRGGWSNPGNQRHASIQKIQYWLRDEKFERVGYPVTDGAKPDDPSILFDHVTALQIRYRSPQGDWLDNWAPTDPSALPAALEMTVTRAGEPPLTLRFLVGAGSAEPVEVVPVSGEGDNAV